MERLLVDQLVEEARGGGEQVRRYLFGCSSGGLPNRRVC